MTREPARAAGNDAMRRLAELGADFDRRQEELLGELAALSDEALAFRPRSGHWTLAEVVHHLALSESAALEGVQRDDPERLRRNGLRERLGRLAVALVFRFGIRVKAPLRRLNPEERISFPAAAERWRDARANLNAWLESLRPEDLEHRVLAHPIAGPMTPEQTVEMLVRHLDHHRRQVRRIRRHPGFPRSPSAG